MKQTLRVATYNIHKGLSFFKRRMVIHELRERLRSLIMQRRSGRRVAVAAYDVPDDPSPADPTLILSTR